MNFTAAYGSHADGEFGRQTVADPTVGRAAIGVLPPAPGGAGGPLCPRQWMTAWEMAAGRVPCRPRGRPGMLIHASVAKTIRNSCHRGHKTLNPKP